MTITALKILYGKGEIILPTLTWVSDINSVIQNNFKPVFVDIDPKSLSMSEVEIIKKVNKNTKAVFLTHAQGFNGLSSKLISFLKKRKIILIEDVCESHGATFKNKKLEKFQTSLFIMLIICLLSRVVWFVQMIKKFMS